MPTSDNLQEEICMFHFKVSLKHWKHWVKRGNSEVGRKNTRRR